MHVTPVDGYNNLFQVEDLVPESLLAKINSTDWLSLPYEITDKQEHFVRKSILDETLPWNQEWRDNIDLFRRTVLLKLLADMGIRLKQWHTTTWWIDEPGFNCGMHVDDPRVKVVIQMYWIGQEINGTTFYNSDNFDSVRKQFIAKPNTGYLAIHIKDDNNQLPELWHAMMEPIPENTFRLTSFTWFVPVK
jgi:hypothetical protein